MFALSDSFIAEFTGRQPAWGPVGYVTYKRTYARDLDRIHERHATLGKFYGLVKSEEWWLTLVRVVEGTYQIQERHCKTLRLPWRDGKAQRSAQEMYRLMWDFKFLPPGRGLWFMGTPTLDKLGGAALNSCAFVSTTDIADDFAEPFCFLMDMSMLGVGVGGDTRGADLVEIRDPSSDDTPHVVEDTREGWVTLIRRILNAYAGRETLPTLVDVSKVRPAGSPIRGFGGTASGPQPLVDLAQALIALLDKRIGSPITSTDIVDIFNLIGKCVVSGNVRRSAEIMFGYPDDKEFLALKDPAVNAEALSSHRWASNNSIFAYVGQDYTKVADLIQRNGEPGCFWLDSARRYGRMMDQPDDKDYAVMGGNPCLEQSLHNYELCCLVETFPAHHTTYYDYQRTLKFAYLYAKTITLVSTHNERTNAIMLRNRRIGCSMSGVVQAQAKFGVRVFFKNFCDPGYNYLTRLDKQYSDWLCVPTSIKRTSNKPSGTVSLLCGATPGVHFPESEYYWRVIRFATDSDMLPALRGAGYRCVEIPNEPNTTAVYFPVREANYTRSARDVSMWEQLELTAQMQHYWADNQVSVTVKFNADEGREIGRALELYETRLKSVSFLPHDNHGYDHAPYQPMTAAEYETAIAALTPLDLSGAKHEVTDAYCDGDKCTLPTST